jgi:hypothetical protein
VREKITRQPRVERRSKVLLTNSRSKKKTGPKETPAGSIYAFAHQAYWGFRFLADRVKVLWRQVLTARTSKEIRQVGRACSTPRVMARAGYGAAGAMTWLNNEDVAYQVLAAKRHRRYPKSGRPTSEDRRMIFLGVAVAAGIYGLSLSTALRKLAEAKLGIEHLIKEVHRTDRLEENVKGQSRVWAEPVGNYFWYTPDGEWTLMHDLPCKLPKNWQGGYIIYGYLPSGFAATFSRTLPTELTENESEDPDKPK